jgi:ABC-type multidrug transport system fused ATPase/permease subunit/GT2 family glycosyltransferase
MRQAPDVLDVLPTINPNPNPYFRHARPRSGGKFFYVADKKLYLRGVTYGTFRPRSIDEGDYGSPEQVDADFAAMAHSGINSVRLYTVPPRWLLDIAGQHGLYVMVGIPWEQHIAFLESKKQKASITGRIREGVRSCAGHPAVLGYAIGNEIPSSMVRWYGHRRVEQFLHRMYNAAKEEDPAALVTYVNYPTTEYLDLSFLDFVSFNVYLETQETLSAYLARLQNLAGDRPLVMGELGLDSMRNGLAKQATTLSWQIETAFNGGCAGAFVFAWTDEWHRGGQDVEDWDFGLTDRMRNPKPALAVVGDTFNRMPFPADKEGDDRLWPFISVVVCSHNGEQTLHDCCEGLLSQEYPHFEVIVVDDGSTDATASIAAEYGFRVVRTANQGLSSARNTGLYAANGEIVAYTDDDAQPDPHWLRYLATSFRTTDYVGIGGPNIPPPTGSTVARCVANAPGGPLHVLINDTEAEHIPGCNMAFRRSSLLEVGGFDPLYRVAGDDVDICWQVQARGWKIGFNPAAMVYHHRRNSIRAYWRQQVGYGRAEALLEKKWPEKYNSAGHVRWAGRLYGDGLVPALWTPRARIYGGVWGSAPFQSVYGPHTNGLLALPSMPEWYFLTGLLLLISLFGFLWSPLLLALPLLALAVAAPLIQAGLGAARATFADPQRHSSPTQLLVPHALTFLLYLIQPLARLAGRLSRGLSPWRNPGTAAPLLAPFWPTTMLTWRETWQSTDDWLEAVEAQIKGTGGAVKRGGNYDRWDLQARGGLLASGRLRMGLEDHSGGRQLARFRMWAALRPGLMWFLFICAGLALYAGTSGAWVAAAVLGLVWLLFAVRTLHECAAAVGTLRAGVRALEGVQLTASGKPPGSRPYRLLLPYAAKFWRGWLFILALTLLSTAVSLAQPWPLKVLVDYVLSAQPLSSVIAQIAAALPGTGTREGLLVWVVLAGVLLFLATGALDTLLTYSWVRVGQTMVYTLARDLFARILRRSLIAHNHGSVGDSLSRITTDSWVVHTAADNLLFAPIHSAITLVSVLVIMFVMDPLLTLLSLVLTPMMALLSMRLGRPIKAASRARRRIESQLHAHVQRNLSSMPVVQAFTREEHERDRFTQFTRSSIRAQRRSALAANLYNLGSGFTVALSSALILWVGAADVLGGKLTTGSLLVFVSYMAVLQSQLKSFTGMARSMQEAAGSAERVAEVLNTRDGVSSRPGAPLLRSPRGAVSLLNVTFGYEPERPVLKGLSLDIEPGRFVAVVGSSGAGKSTLAALIARLYDPWQGQVEIDGQDVRKVDLKSLREAVAITLQEPFLFAATVSDNIRYGRSSATYREVQLAAAAAGARGFIEQLPNRYDTLLGERGGTLSGGERQRLSIARALVKDAPILVLDEPTSALDVETEQLLVHALRELRSGKTTIVIAHRLSTVRDADKIIVMAGGEVAESGTHDQLIERRGLYWHLYNLQSAGQPVVGGANR